MLRLSWDEIEQVKGGLPLTLTRERGSNLHGLYAASKGNKVRCEICTGFGLTELLPALVSVERVKFLRAGDQDYYYRIIVYEVGAA